jgi:hypothetical protein
MPAAPKVPLKKAAELATRCVMNAMQLTAEAEARLELYADYGAWLAALPKTERDLIGHWQAMRAAHSRRAAGGRTTDTCSAPRSTEGPR